MQEYSYQLTKDREEKKLIKPPKRFGYVKLIAFTLVIAYDVDDKETKCFKKAIQSPFKSKWQKAVAEEIAFLYKNETWELVKKPTNRGVVRCKWIFKIKEGFIKLESKRFKARLIAEGYIQKEGVDFKEVFSPIVRHALIRVILALTIVKPMK